MARSLLVLGGSGFVGHAVVAEGLARGWQVTTFNRGRSSQRAPAGVRRLHGDRDAAGVDPAGEGRRGAALAPLRDVHADVVVDTWSGAPAAARDAAEVLRDRVGHYVYISSGSVYASLRSVGVDESAATVAADPDDDTAEDYAAAKRGAELAVVRALGEHRVLLARAGLILGPREDVGRLPWWLGRMARGGEVLAPGEPQRPLSFVDARDLAAFVLDAALAGLAGPCNVVARRGHATMGGLLHACRDVAGPLGTSLTWVAPAVIERAGIEPWTELPIWLPPDGDFEALHGMGVERAHAAGLRSRPATDTVADTWAWMRSLSGPPPLRGDLPAPGLDPERERAALTLARGG